MKFVKLSAAILLIICIVMAAMIAGCGQRESEQVQTPEAPEQPETAPPAQDEQQQPKEFLEADASAGKAIYDERCASCHGATGKPAEAFADQTADFSSDDYQDTPPQEIFNITKNGRGSMPAYKDQLTDEQIWDVTAYVKSL